MFTKEITTDGVVLDSGEVIPADTVVISIGDAPDLSFLPEDVASELVSQLQRNDYALIRAGYSEVEKQRQR